MTSRGAPARSPTPGRSVAAAGSAPQKGQLAPGGASGAPQLGHSVAAATAAACHGRAGPRTLVAPESGPEGACGQDDGVDLAPASWTVGCTLSFQVDQPATIALQVAVADVPGRTVVERLDVTLGGTPLAVEEVAGPHGGRIHRLDAPPGCLHAAYRAAATDGPARGSAGEPPEVAHERLVALRPSRYCPSDALLGFASAELGGRAPDAALARAVAGWVAGRIAYAPGSSGPSDSAVETLLSGQGVCRDFAHLTIGLCRAVGIPARLVAAYAPGLSPMDFHAVVEAHVDGAWQVFDPTSLAPRPSLLRIATGRDAADTAFADVLSGVATLTAIEVTAVLDGTLPWDDGTASVRLR